MNNPVLRNFEQLAAIAAVEQSPKIDVANRVMKSLRRRHSHASPEKDAFQFFAGAIAVAGLSVAMMFVVSGNDSLVAIGLPFVSVMP